MKDQTEEIANIPTDVVEDLLNEAIVMVDAKYYSSQGKQKKI